MERLPYIDQHSIVIRASPERVWDALAPTLRVSLGRAAPARLARRVGVSPARPSGDWGSSPHEGDALPGFEVAEARAPERLALRGSHRFARYALVFELDPLDDKRCSLRAQTWAEFPGAAGRVYRALVIGSGGHRIVVRLMLRNIARHV